MKFDINVKNERGETALVYATKFGHKDIVQYLISENVDLDTRDAQGRSPFMLAVKNYECMTILLTHAENKTSLFLFTNEGESILIMACAYGQIRVAKRIIAMLSASDMETFINHQDENGYTALHKACEYRQADTRYKLAEMLLSAGADPLICESSQMSTPLHLATAKNDVHLVTLLFSGDGHVNCVDKNGVSPLFIAAENGFSGIVIALLAKGAETMQCRHSDRASPLLISSERGHLEVVKKLLENMKGQNSINLANFENSTPLLLATLNNHTKICEILLENNADINIQNKNGYNPILVASRNGNAKLISLFLQNGADIDSHTLDDGNTPLHFAAMMGNKVATKILLTRGADMEKKNEQGLTPVVVASYMKQEDIIFTT
ncbi:hypothetical protein FSP39_005557 [Pinctada imbricata]|uniref:Ankyrin repeat protein n=1 Tax=Pinctada imbricata TaxID=66713 RepID=A0AA88XDN6_PINIB|nr:hypothetical protein FSP39_005557 [Pinctada imbricata]